MRLQLLLDAGASLGIEQIRIVDDAAGQRRKLRLGCEREKREEQEEKQEDQGDARRQWTRLSPLWGRAGEGVVSREGKRLALPAR